jgi:antitoxin (DNA-binding transcriptional repressor) of toxin-antitoxin stability system
MIRVSVSEAKEKLEELIAKAAMGETVEITSETQAAQIVLVPTLYSRDVFISEIDDPENHDLYVPKKGPRKLGTAEGQIWIADDFDAPLDDFKEYIE